MRINRRRVLNAAGWLLLLTLLLQTIFLITGLLSYAERAELPFRIIEMLAVITAALFTRYISFAFGSLFLAAASLLSLVATIRDLAGGAAIADGSPVTVGRFVDVGMIAGFLLLFAVSILIRPTVPRSAAVVRLIRIFSDIIVEIFVAVFAYRLFALVRALIYESYSGQFVTKYYYSRITTCIALVLIGVACFMTADIEPTKPAKKAA